MRMKTLCAAVAGALLLVTAASAADDPVLTREYVLAAPAGQGAALEAAIKTHGAWRQENGDPWSWSVYQVVASEEMLGAYIIRSSQHRWADLDVYDGSEFAAKANAEYQATVAPHVAYAGASVLAEDSRADNWPQDASKLRYVMVFGYHLKPGMDRQFGDAMAKFTTAAKDTKWPGRFAMEWVAVGGAVPTAYLAIPADNWAGLAQPEPEPYEVLKAKYGDKEGSKIRDAFEGAIKHMTSTVVVYRPDLGVTAAAK